MTKRLFGIILMMMLMTTLSLKVSAGPVTVKLDTYPHGSVTVDKATANPGETVTITVTPDPGYYCAKENVKAEKTIDGGSAQAPGLKANPGVGSFVEIQGDAPADIRDVATYTFTMPEAPYGVQVTAEFSTCSIIYASFIQPIPDQEYTGSEITPNVIVADGDNQLTLGVDYTVEFSNNVEPGQATCTVKGISRYTGNVTVNFTIFRETYEIRWGITPQGSNDWDSQHVIAMTKGADGKWVAADQEMAATSEFKVVKKREAGETTDTWYGAPADGLYWITTDNLNTEIQLGEGNQNLYFPHSGTYTFTFDPATTKLVVTGDMIYNVTVADGIQNGTVVANPTSGKAGDPITITATPDPGYELETLTYTAEGGNPVEIENNQFTMPAANVTINATFKKTTYHITIAPTENGSVDISMPDAHMGDEIGIQPRPNTDYVVDQVTVTAENGEPVTVSDGYTFIMPASNVTVAVTFRALTISYEIRWGQGNPWAEEHVIAMTKNETSGEWVAINQFMEAGNEFKVVKKAQDGDNEPVLTWYGAQADGMYWITADKLGFEIQLGSEAGYNNLYFPKAGNYTFNFNPSNNKLTVTGAVLYNISYSIGTGGTVTADKTQATAQEEVTVTVTPDPGYEIDVLKYAYEGLMPDGTPTGLHFENPIENGKFTMPAADVTIFASFKKINYNITVSAPNQCTVEVPATAQLGDNVTVTVTTDTGYEVEELRYEFISVPAETGGEGVHVSYVIENGQFTMPAADVTILVTLKKTDYTITVAQTQNGTVTAPATANYGDEVTLTVTPAEGYELESLTYTVEGGEPVAIENNKFTMPAANVTINATFKEIVVEYYYDFVEQVHCTLLDETEYHHTAPAGATITLRVVADSDYKLKQAIVNKVTGEGPEQVVEAIEHTISVENDNTYLTFVMPEGNVEVHAICAEIHTITLDDGDDANNFATIDNEYSQAIEGETVTVRTHLNEEYKVSEIYYTYMLNDVETRGELTAGENGVYTFTMPDADVTVVVRFDYKVPRHIVKFFPEVEGGTISVTANYTPINSMDEVPEISIIEITVTPNPGYVLDDLKIYEGLHEIDDDFLGVNTVSWDLYEGKYRFELHFTDVTIIPTFKMEEVELEGVTFTANRQWATYYNGTKNLALPQGVKAYVVNGVVNNAVDITEIDYIPAGVGVLLYSENAAEQVMTTLYTGETSSYTSLLVGSDQAQTITAGYVLYNNNFIRSEEGTVAAHRCYLPANEVAGAPRLLKIGYDGDVPTAIESIIAQGNVAGIKYVNLNGMTSNEPFRGINIAVITFTDGTTTTMKIVK